MQIMAVLVSNMRDSVGIRLRRLAGVLALLSRAAKKFGVPTSAVLRRAVAFYLRFDIGPNELLVHPLIDGQFMLRISRGPRAKHLRSP
jgi:hypothetical protein